MAASTAKTAQPTLFEIDGYVAPRTIVNFGGTIDIDLQANPKMAEVLQLGNEVELRIKGRIEGKKMSAPNGKAPVGQIIINGSSVMVAGKEFITKSAAAEEKRKKSDVFDPDNDVPDNVKSIAAPKDEPK